MNTEIATTERDRKIAKTATKVQTCPNCKGEKAVAHKCTCGTLTTNPAYSRCGSCYRVIDWRSCPVCNGKGTIIINN